MGLSNKQAFFLIFGVLFVAIYDIVALNIVEKYGKIFSIISFDILCIFLLIIIFFYTARKNKNSDGV